MSATLPRPGDLAAPARVERSARTALVAGGAGLLLTALGAFFDPDQFFRSYLFGFLFWTSVAVGRLSIALVSHLTGAVSRPKELNTTGVTRNVYMKIPPTHRASARLLECQGGLLSLVHLDSIHGRCPLLPIVTELQSVAPARITIIIYGHTFLLELIIPEMVIEVRTWLYDPSLSAEKQIGGNRTSRERTCKN